MDEWKKNTNGLIMCFTQFCLCHVVPPLLWRIISVVPLFPPRWVSGSNTVVKKLLSPVFLLPVFIRQQATQDTPTTGLSNLYLPFRWSWTAGSDCVTAHRCPAFLCKLVLLWCQMQFKFRQRIETSLEFRQIFYITDSCHSIVIVQW